MLAQDVSAKNLFGTHTTVSLTDETIPLSEDGAAPALSIAVPAGKRLVISDVGLCVPADVIYSLQKSVDNGTSWFNVCIWRLPSSGGATRTFRFKTPPEWNGGAGVLLRMRVRTPGGPQTVTVTLTGASDP